MEENPNYYAVIPADVRYDEKLKDKAKLLYGEITALSNKYGYCYATNKYFATLYKVSPTTISLLIKNLVECGYLESSIIYKDGTKEILNRYLKIVKEGYLKKVKDNTTSINTTSTNNIYNKYGVYKRIKLTDKEYKKLVEDYGEDYIKRQINLLDEYVESNNNKNKYTNFNLVLRKSIREKWFTKKTSVEYTPIWFDEMTDNVELNSKEREEFEDILKEIGE